MSMLRSIRYDLRASDTYQSKHFINRSVKENTPTLNCSAAVEVWSMADEGRLCNFAELKSLDISSGYSGRYAKISIHDCKDPSESCYTSGWLRAVARMFNHLADNMDRLPTHEQTIATMVANRME
jgi:hypothetical protein